MPPGNSRELSRPGWKRPVSLCILPSEITIPLPRRIDRSLLFKFPVATEWGKGLENPSCHPELILSEIIGHNHDLDEIMAIF